MSTSLPPRRRLRSPLTALPVLPAAFALLSVGLGSCSGLADAQGGQSTGAAGASGAESAAQRPAPSEVDPPAAPAEEPPSAPAPAPPLAPVVLRELPRISPVTSEMRQHLLSIVAHDPSLEDSVFAKMGGSSVVSQAYLYCFAGDDVDLGARGDLAPTLEAFRGARVQGGSVFTRTSEAAGVGWSLRQGMTGRPSRIQRELRALSPRYALAFFGGNDVQGLNPQVYARRLIALVEELIAQGVIPILGAIQPRRNREMEPWVRRFNSITAAVASAWRLPYVDFHQAMLPLPGMGLAGDGVHPNVFRRGHRVLACDLTEEGLSGGHNVRNLLTLDVLHRVREAILSSDEAFEAPPSDPLDALPPVGEGTVDSPEGIRALPFAARLTPTVAVLDHYDGCEAAGAPGPERVYQLRVDEPMRVRATVVTREDNVHVGIYHLGETLDASLCAGGGTSESLFDLEPGLHHFVVEVDPEGVANQSDTSVLFALVPEHRR